MIVRIDPACDAMYAFYYVKGLRMLFENHRVLFDSGPFKRFKHTLDYMPIEVDMGKGDVRRIVIDFGDTRTFRKEVYDWADVYAKVNLTPEDHAAFDKMLPIGPASLGIRCCGKVGTMVLAFRNYLKARSRIPSAAAFLSGYKASLRRLTLNGYHQPLASDPDYVHFVSTLWKDDKVANENRVNFMQAVRQVEELRFEGGFAPRADGLTLGYESYIGPAFESLETYRQKIGQSFVVFNTPAVKQCHGWKLPEFLAWGKAIISIPPVRMFPEPMVDGVHWLLTDGTVKDIESKIRRLRDEPELHASLEANARSYFDTYLKPDVAMRRVLRQAGIILPS